MTNVTLKTVRTAGEADLVISLLRSAEFHPIDISMSSHFSVAGVDVSYPIEVPVTEASAAREFLAACDKSETSS